VLPASCRGPGVAWPVQSQDHQRAGIASSAPPSASTWSSRCAPARSGAWDRAAIEERRDAYCPDRSGNRKRDAIVNASCHAPFRSLNSLPSLKKRVTIVSAPAHPITTAAISIR